MNMLDIDQYLRYDFNMTKAMLTVRQQVPIQIKKVIFADPATIVFWADGTKTVVKAENETFDLEKGLAMAIAKKALGNKGNYYEVFKEHLAEVVYDNKKEKK